MFKLNYNCIIYLILILSFMFVVAGSMGTATAGDIGDNKESIKLLKEYKEINIKEIKQLKNSYKKNDRAIKNIKKYNIKKHILVEKQLKIDYKISKKYNKIRQINKSIMILKRRL